MILRQWRNIFGAFASSARRRLRTFIPALETLLRRLFSSLKSLLFLTLSIALWPLFRLELVSAVVQNWKIKDEGLKKVSEQHRWKAIRECCIHLLPIATTGLLLFLNFSTDFWRPVGSPDQKARFNALQFAAKIHEVLIGASLSIVLLSCVHYELLRGRGVPLGSLFAGFQISDLRSLWHPQLWATLLSHDARIRPVLLGLITALLVVLGAIVGPSSAILMLPSLDWWEAAIPKSEAGLGFQKNPVSSEFYIGAGSSTLWPTHLNHSNYLQSDCNFRNASIAQHCPAGGLSNILDWATPGSLFGNLWNISIPADVGRHKPFIRFLEGAYLGTFVPNDPGPYAYFSQTITAVIASSLIRTYQNFYLPNVTERWTLKISGGRPLLAPQTHVICNANQTQAWRRGEFGTNSTIESMQLSFPPYDPSSQPSWSSDVEALVRAYNSSNQYGALWVEPPDMGDNAPSIGAAIVGNCTSGFGSQDYICFTACSVYGGWRKAEIYMDPETDFFIHSPSLDDPAGTLQGWDLSNPNAGNLQNVKVDIDWANQALPIVQTIGRLTEALDVAGNGWTIGFGVALSVLFTDAMARIGADSDTILTGTILDPQLDDIESYGITYMNASEIDPRNATEVDIRRFRFGYNYSMRGFTRRLAAGILLTHVFIALVHTAVTTWYGWICLSMKCTCEMLVLAINSSQTRTLENTCAGIARLDTYKHVVKVREHFDTHLELVFDDNGTLEAPKDGKKYG